MYNLSISLHIRTGPTWGACSQSRILTIHHGRWSVFLCSPPSPPPAIPPLKDNINEVSLQEKNQNMDKNWLMLHQSLTWVTYLLLRTIFVPLWPYHPTLAYCSTLTESCQQCGSYSRKDNYFWGKIINSSNRHYSIDSEDTQPSSSETMETEETPP